MESNSDFEVQNMNLDSLIFIENKISWGYIKIFYNLVSTFLRVWFKLFQVCLMNKSETKLC